MQKKLFIKMLKLVSQQIEEKKCQNIKDTAR